jgi:NAD(P)-dependent dehydrogenase (short-subunit alcohol dehydrogenase family)
MKRFSGQVALVSGAADGLGKGIAQRIASEGGQVALFDINEESLDRTVSEFQNMGFAVHGIAGDISSESSVQEVFKKTETKFGKIDIMVNSGGIIGVTESKIADYPVEEFDKVYRVNLRGSFLMTKYAVQAMEKHNYGRILLIASIAGKEGNPFMAGYSATKAGVIGLVKGISKEYAKTGITINGLAPALIKTAMNDDIVAEQLAYMTSKIPMGRLGDIGEVASLASWIVSKEASFNTGFIFDISGGRATY